MSLTSLLDLSGALLLILGLALFVAVASVPAAVMLAGGLMVALSWLLDRKAS